ncbi:PepSY-associated TM helix domain-containing protein [Pseudoalteromonas ulvae]|uniref:Peptidase n=1 Tax=Pseudoalteromonas ulvae TaxID=107327 RepID=A0A244CQY9_PSEDV|nr:PepSY-associated TM helix domain-containing protein [Pseudoalteromonas ulvae]OUL58047.1 hypothetical protein B1199_06745 [Pseudoalteromonas ulvae]
MKESFFRSMTWLHTWVGLTVCWLLFLVFFAGTLSFFRHEISLWQQPALHSVSVQAITPQTQAEQVEFALSRFNEIAPVADNWRITFPTERKPALALTYQAVRDDNKRGKRTTEYVDATSFAPIEGIRDTKGGNFFYRLHFDLHYLDRGLARWIVGFASLFMLIALISGVVIHKRIFKDMFSFRRNKGTRTWLDAHNLSSVVALPFHIMITYTGIVTLIFMYFPYPILTAYDGDFQAFAQEQSATRIHNERAAEAAQMVSVSSVWPNVQQQWPNGVLSSITVEHPHDSSAQYIFRLNTQQTIRDDAPTLVFSATSGELLAQSHPELSASETVYDSMTALHTGRLASPLLRWLYFVCGIAGCVMIGSGCVMWAKRIREKNKQATRPSFGLKLVEGLNLATLMGLPLATAGYFYANRLLPLGLADRANQEVTVFFLLWGLAAIVAIFKRTRATWFQFAIANAGVWFLLPVVNSLTVTGHTLGYLLDRQWVLFGFDVICWAVAAVCSYQAYHLKNSSRNNVRSNAFSGVNKPKVQHNG